MNIVWIVEHREWEDADHMNTVVVYVASSKENAENYIQHTRVDERGWICIYAEPVDVDKLTDTGMDADVFSLEFYDLNGNSLDGEQPQYESEYDKGYREGIATARQQHEQNVQDTYNVGYHDGHTKGVTEASNRDSSIKIYTNIPDPVQLEQAATDGYERGRREAEKEMTQRKGHSS